ncbi:MAG: hypothetical protein IPJ90_10690 [Anaerolineaceae bacterium]|nr:hypothetical protein [Anaerolineaceae bacterium]
MFDALNDIEKLLGQAFADAPRELKAILQNIFQALEKKRNGQNSCGEALAYLRQAQEIITKQQLTEWQAELHALWASYYLYNCPNLEPDKRNEEQGLWYHIRKAQQLEPTNHVLNQVIERIQKIK